MSLNSQRLSRKVEIAILLLELIPAGDGCDLAEHAKELIAALRKLQIDPSKANKQKALKLVMTLKQWLQEDPDKADAVSKCAYAEFLLREI